MTKYNIQEIRDNKSSLSHFVRKDFSWVRNLEIAEKYLTNNVSTYTLAKEYKLTSPRVAQIIRFVETRIFPLLAIIKNQKTNQ